MSHSLVLMDHDGGVDDYLALLLLLTIEHVELLGVVVTPADCYAQPAVSVTRKILDLWGEASVPVAESTVRGVNPFPMLYRRDSFVVDHLPILNESEQIRTFLVRETGQQWMVKALQQAEHPVTLMVTGPLTTVAAAIAIAPEITAQIEKIVWMGGALNVPGNVSAEVEPGQDGTAEWNAYWDPFAVEFIWQTELPIILCPLDLTNCVPVTSEFLHRIARQRRYPRSDFAGQCYALAIPQDYYFWDVLATAYLGCPDFYQLQPYETAAIATGSSQGRIHLQAGGRPIQVMQSVDVDRFYAYLLKQWSS